MTCIAVVKQDGKVYMAGDRGASDRSIRSSLGGPVYSPSASQPFTPPRYFPEGGGRRQ
jgi:hypothetical protein